MVRNAEVQLLEVVGTGAKASVTPIRSTHTDAHGRFVFLGQEPGSYRLRCTAFGLKKPAEATVSESADHVVLALDMSFTVTPHKRLDHERQAQTTHAMVGHPLLLQAEWTPDAKIGRICWQSPESGMLVELSDSEAEVVFSRAGKAVVEASASDASGGGAEAVGLAQVGVSMAVVQNVRGAMDVTLNRAATDPTLDQALWVAIRARTHAISFNRYREFISRVLRWEENERFPEAIERRVKDLGTHLRGVGAYQVLKTATEIFLLMECGVRLDLCDAERLNLLEEDSRLGEALTAEQISARLSEYLGRPPQLPYIRRVVEAAFPEYEHATRGRDRVLTARINEPCLLELIWSYWHEEGMLMQTINALSQRFQNIRAPGIRDPLSNMEIDPLRPVNNLIWGYIQDEVNRLSVSRRAHEYAHGLGATLLGRAVHGLPAADVRSKFFEALHSLLYQASVFFKEDMQTTVLADGFPLLNALKEVHLILAQGAHNQFGDLPWTARAEMLLSQYILSRPEVRDFLQSRVMVPYREAWMPQVDAMKTLQGWSDVTITHFRDLGVYGEQLLLSIRYGDWINVDDENSAKNWARYWKPELQGYWAAYRAVTGIDLTNPEMVDATPPALLLKRRLAMQQQRPW